MLFLYVPALMIIIEGYNFLFQSFDKEPHWALLKELFTQVGYFLQGV